MELQEKTPKKDKRKSFLAVLAHKKDSPIPALAVETAAPEGKSIAMQTSLQDKMLTSIRYR